MILNITISDEDGLIQGHYIVTSTNPDTIEEMDEIETNGMFYREKAVQVISEDLNIYFKDAE
tara:strand:- start:1128 stop:1313 length:186 start_codon:yes stop_codon:yes gene_type:complete